VAPLTVNGFPGQHLVAQAVYLDHRALLQIALNQELARRFKTGLRGRCGMLALSRANVAGSNPRNARWHHSYLPSSPGLTDISSMV